jgi:hypothetical protein
VKNMESSVWPSMSSRDACAADVLKFLRKVADFGAVRVQLSKPVGNVKVLYHERIWEITEHNDLEKLSLEIADYCVGSGPGILSEITMRRPRQAHQ